jgi:hypothetical protein
LSELKVLADLVFALDLDQITLSFRLFQFCIVSSYSYHVVGVHLQVT